MKKRFLIAAAAAFLAAAALFYLYRTEEGAGAGIPCVFHLLTGWYCPGCGASRALRSLLHFDLGQALRYNAPFAVASPFVGIYALSLAVSFVRFGEDRVSRRIPLVPVIVFAALCLLYGALRNLSAFAFLAPTAI